VLKIILPITASFQRHREEFTRPVALEEVDRRPAIAWVLESLQDLLAAASITFIARAEHEDRFDVTGQLRELLGRQTTVAVLDRAPRGELATVLKVRSELRGNDELLIARGDRAVRSALRKRIEDQRPGGSAASKVRGIVSVIGKLGVQGPVVRADREKPLWIGAGARVTEVTGRDRLVPLIPTGVCWFASSDEFLAAADALVGRGQTPEARAGILEQAEPVECVNEFVARGWPVETLQASEVRYLWPNDSARLAFESG
jgi:hypothetical protein